MDSEAFLHDLDRAVQSRLSRIGDAQDASPAPTLTVAQLLVTALKKELEASEEAARWMLSEPDVDVKLSLARQCGDEAKHYKLIEARLKELGVDTSKLAPLDGGPTPMFTFLGSLETTVERIAAGQFTREALAQVLNEAFIAFCEAQNDPATAALYRDVIQPDEAHHHALGRKLLARLATTDEQQAKARTVAIRTLEIAADVQELMRLKKGISRAPGC
jgi:1,2-phenylacetyl-CoA epoxidase catalytic subunit